MVASSLGTTLEGGTQKDFIMFLESGLEISIKAVASLVQ
jgi:hypothetical protein